MRSGIAGYCLFCFETVTGARVSGCDRLLERMEHSRTAELEALFRQHHRLLHRYVYQIVGNPDDAWEIVQETFLRLWKLASAPETAWTERGYIFNLARNIAIDAFRRNRVRTRYAAQVAMIYDVPGTVATPEEAFLDRERNSIAHAALEHLGTRDREVLTLRGSGFSYDEIAVIMGLNRNSVGQMVSRALGKCRSTCAAKLETRRGARTCVDPAMTN